LASLGAYATCDEETKTDAVTKALSTAPITAPAAAPAVAQTALKGETVVLSVRKMHCGGCVSKVEKLVKETVPGAEGVTVDLEKKEARFTCNASSCDVGKVTAAITKIGYPAAWAR